MAFSVNQIVLTPRYMKLLLATLLATAVLAIAATAQTLTPIYSFTNFPAHPRANLLQGADGNFYGTTSQGGSRGDGTVFRVTTNGTLTALVSFTGGNGANPDAGLSLGSDGNFYGTTPSGGSFDYGTVFRVTANGGLTTLVRFKGTNGAAPLAGLTLGSDGYFYGTTSW